ncbi:MAG: response regulator [Acidobacteria bacterium]|nr:response regulator [Acidobacteriota bacterium]
MRAKQAILVVDDEARVRELIRSFLIEDYDVMLAADGREAIACYELHAGRIAAVITDVRMPRCDGRELAEWLHGRRPQLPVIVVSGNAEDGRLPPRRELVWLEKPFAAKELVATLKRMLEATGARY